MPAGAGSVGAGSAVVDGVADPASTAFCPGLEGLVWRAWLIDTLLNKALYISPRTELSNYACVLSVTFGIQ